MDYRGEKRTIETEQQDTTQPKKARQRVKVKMDDIPNHLLLELFQYFDHMEKHYRRGVSKRWLTVLKSRSIIMQTYVAIEVPVNVKPNSRPGEIPEEFIWTVGKHIKTIVFYGRSEKFVTASMAHIIGARMKRFTKAQRAMFQDIQSYLHCEALNYVVTNNVDFIGSVSRQLGLEYRGRRSYDKVILGCLDISLELLDENPMNLSLCHDTPIFVKNIRIPAVDKHVASVIGGHDCMERGPQCVAMYKVTGYEKAEKPSRSFDRHSYNSNIELSLAEKYMPALTPEQSEELQKQLQKMSYRKQWRTRLILSERYPDEFSYNKLEKIPQKEVIPIVLQKRDVAYLLYWWFFFMREHVKPMHDVIDQRYRKKYGSPIRDPEYDDYPEDEDSDFPDGEDDGGGSDDE